MNRWKGIIYTILASIPVGFGLFLLATIHIVFFLVGLVAVLGALLLLKHLRPQTFAWMRRAEKPAQESSTGTLNSGNTVKPQRVYMVLAEHEGQEAVRIAVNKETFTIGRESDNDFVLPGDRISRHHLRIDYSPEQDICFATDLNSANGTYINSSRLKGDERHMLVQGDNLMIDDRPFTVEYAHY